jgi:Tfp pilus assembly protein PilF
MKKHFFFLAFIALLHSAAFAQTDPLDKYIAHIKQAYEKRSSETSMGTVGYEMVYGLEYFDAKSYDYASWRFEAIIRMDAAHPYAHYLLGLCQLAMGMEAKGKESLNKAVEILPELKTRLESDLARYTKKPEPKTAAKPATPKETTVTKKETTPVKKVNKPASEKTGGPLVFGNYTCDYMQYQGAGALVAYKPVYKGYFKLNANGTYRWLDNGETGRYKYDAATGKITWLSGYLAKSKPVSSVYKPGEKVASIRIEMVKDYTWGCGCNK